MGFVILQGYVSCKGKGNETDINGEVMMMMMMTTIMILMRTMMMMMMMMGLL